MKRRGFTLIELMVVIAIIIILAAIAIPNYLKMTERAKKSRIAADFGALALSLESYKVDWGIYPVLGANEFGSHLDVSAATLSSTFAKEIGGQHGAGDATADATLPNYTGHTTATGEKGCIEYMKPGTLVSMANPFNAGWDYFYIGTIDDWGLYAQAKTAAPGMYLARNSTVTTLVERGTVPTTVSDCGTGT